MSACLKTINYLVDVLQVNYRSMAFWRVMNYALIKLFLDRFDINSFYDAE